MYTIQEKKYTVRIRHAKKVRHLLALQAARTAAGLAHPLPPRRCNRCAYMLTLPSGTAWYHTLTCGAAFMTNQRHGEPWGEICHNALTP